MDLCLGQQRLHDGLIVSNTDLKNKTRLSDSAVAE